MIGVDKDRELQLQTTSEMLGLNIRSTIDDIYEYPNFDLKNLVGDLFEVHQSETSKKEKSMYDAMEESKSKTTIKISKQDIQLQNIATEICNDRLKVLDNIIKIKDILFVAKGYGENYMSIESSKEVSVDNLREIRDYLDEILELKLIANK